MIDLTNFKRKQFSFELTPSKNAGVTRFVVVIGPNGAGKSRLLGELAESAIDRLHEHSFVTPSITGPVLGVSSLITDPFTRTRTKGGAFHYLGVRTRAGNSTSTGSIRSITIDAILACLRDDWRINAVRAAFKLAGFDDFGIRAMPLGEKRDGYRSGLLNRLDEPDAERLISNLRLLGDEQFPFGYGQVDWTVFLARAKSLTATFDFTDEESIALAWQYALPRPDLTVKIKGNNHDIGDLSVGQILLISMIARVAANVEVGALVLIDEPEAGLHPSWQSEVIPLLRSAIPASLSAEVFIATHSPHLVADADHVLVPGLHWGEFNEFEGGIAGRSVENVLYRVFEAKVTGNRMVAQDLARLTKFIAGTDREDLEEADRAVERLRKVSAADTPTVNSLLRSFADVRRGRQI